MKVKLLFFASCRETIGCKETEMEVAEGMTAGGLKEALVALYPALRPLKGVLSVAINTEYVGDEAPLSPGDEVAFIPPVSGG